MLEDGDFIKSCDVPGPTKEAIRAIIVYKSGVTPEDKVVDCVLFVPVRLDCDKVSVTRS